MAKGDLIRLGLFSILLVIVIGFYSNLGVLTFTNVNVSETLPKPVKTEPSILGNNIPSITASVMGIQCAIVPATCVIVVSGAAPTHSRLAIIVATAVPLVLEFARPSP